MTWTAFALKSQPEFTTNLKPDTPCSLSVFLVPEGTLAIYASFWPSLCRGTKQGWADAILQKHVMRYPQYFLWHVLSKKRLQKASIIKGLSGIHKVQVRPPLAFNIRYLTNYFSKEWESFLSFIFVVDRLDPWRTKPFFKEFNKRGLKVKRINNPLRTQSKQDGYDVVVVNIQKFKDDSDLTDRSGYDHNRQNVYFIDEAHRFTMNVVPTYQIYQVDTKAKIAFDWTPLVTYKKDGKTKESQVTTRDILGTISTNITTTSLSMTALPYAWCEKISRRLIRLISASINEEIQRMTCPRKISLLILTMWSPC